MVQNIKSRFFIMKCTSFKQEYLKSLRIEIKHLLVNKNTEILLEKMSAIKAKIVICVSKNNFLYTIKTFYIFLFYFEQH